MTPVRFAQANFIFTAPPGLPEGACGDLHVFRDGQNVISCWQPTPEERAMIAAGGPVWLRVMGAGTPPVLVTADSPFIEPPDTRRAEEIQDGAPCCASCRHLDIDAGNFCTRWKQRTTATYVCREHEPLGL